MIETLPRDLRRELVLYRNNQIKNDFRYSFSIIENEYLFTPHLTKLRGIISIYTYDQAKKKVHLLCESNVDKGSSVIKSLGISNLIDGPVLYVYGFRLGKLDEYSWELICLYQTSIGLKYIYCTCHFDHRIYDLNTEIYLCDKYEPLIHDCISEDICKQLNLERFL